MNEKASVSKELNAKHKKVRSATLDTWLPEQVAFIQSMGNEKSNSYWEAELLPNYDRVGIENFIRAKGVYGSNLWNNVLDKCSSGARDEKSSESQTSVSMGGHNQRSSFEQHRTSLAAVSKIAPVVSRTPTQINAPGGLSSGNTVKLKDLVPAATNNVNTTFIVLDKAARAAPPHGHADAREETCLALVADETAAAHFLLWGAECDAFEAGDIVRLTGGIFSYHRSNSLVLRAGRRGRTEKVGEFTMLFVETPNMSEVKWARDPGDPRRMVQEAVVSPHSQVFKPLQ